MYHRFINIFFLGNILEVVYFYSYRVHSTTYKNPSSSHGAPPTTKPYYCLFNPRPTPPFIKTIYQCSPLVTHYFSVLYKNSRMNWFLKPYQCSRLVTHQLRYVLYAKLRINWWFFRSGQTMVHLMHITLWYVNLRHGLLSLSLCVISLSLQQIIEGWVKESRVQK